MAKGKNMKNFILFGVFAIFMAGGAFAYTFYPGTHGDECWLEEDGNDEYWFCGNQSASCHGVAADGDDIRHWLYRRGLGTDTFTHADRSFVCCGGSGSGYGSFVEYTDESYEMESIKYLNEEKTEFCTMIANPCYNWWMNTQGRNIVPSTFDQYAHYVILDCNTHGQHICIEGTILRKIFNDKHEEQEGRCVTPCSSANEGYESYNGDTCVTCNKTANQGKDKYGTCVFCNSDEFFMNDNKYGTGNNARDCAGSECCVKKTTMPVAMHSALEWCYRCDQDKDLWRHCLSGGLDGDDFGRCSVSTQIPDNLKVNLHL